MAKLFDNISKKGKEKLLNLLYTHTYNYPKNRHILATTNDDNTLIYVETGIIEIYKTTYTGQKQLIDTFEDEELFGTIITGIKGQEFDIVTKEDTTVTIIDYENIINLDDHSKDYFNFTKNLYKIMYERIENQNNRIKILSEKTIRNKLLTYFKIASHKHKSKYIYITEGFSALADFLATDRSALSREMHNMEQEGFIEIKNKRITLLYR